MFMSVEEIVRLVWREVLAFVLLISILKVKYDLTDAWFLAMCMAFAFVLYMWRFMR